jgi:hypothetical protein
VIASVSDSLSDSGMTLVIGWRSASGLQSGTGWVSELGSGFEIEKAIETASDSRFESAMETATRCCSEPDWMFATDLSSSTASGWHSDSETAMMSESGSHLGFDSQTVIGLETETAMRSAFDL